MSLGCFPPAWLFLHSWFLARVLRHLVRLQSNSSWVFVSVSQNQVLFGWNVFEYLVLCRSFFQENCTCWWLFPRYLMLFFKARILTFFRVAYLQKKSTQASDGIDGFGPHNFTSFVFFRSTLLSKFQPFFTKLYLFLSFLKLSSLNVLGTREKSPTVEFRVVYLFVFHHFALFISSRRAFKMECFCLKHSIFQVWEWIDAPDFFFLWESVFSSVLGHGFSTIVFGYCVINSLPTHH